MYLLSSDLSAGITASYTFAFLFKKAPVVEAKDLIIPSVGEYSCYNMFADCEELTSGPFLPADSLFADCYNTMFIRCKKLTSVKMLASKKSTNCFNSFLKNAGDSTSTPKFLTVAASMLNDSTLKADVAGWNIENGADTLWAYGKNGWGLKIGTTVWAPVNCGYDKKKYPLGKLYQWGRKDGSGYGGSETKQTVVAASWPDNGYTKSPAANTFYSTSAIPNDWYTSAGEHLSEWPMEDPAGTTGIGNPCPAGWKVPSMADFASLDPSLTSTWGAGWDDTNNGQWLNGTTSPIVGDGLFLPGCGMLDKSGNASYRGSSGYYWSTTINSGNPNNITYYNIGSSFTSKTNSYNRAAAFSVRCIKE